MVALVIVEVEIQDPAAFEEYRKAAPATVAAFGGKYLARGATGETLEGDAPSRRLTIIQFDNLAQAKAWYDSPQYRPLREIRARTTKSTMRIIEGL